MAAIMDELGTDARMVCIKDHAGNVLMGKEPTPDACVLSADFISFVTSFGYPKTTRGGT